MADKFPRSFLVYAEPMRDASDVCDLLAGLTQEPTPFRASRLPTREEWRAQREQMRRAEAERCKAEGRRARAYMEAVARLRAVTSETEFAHYMDELWTEAYRKHGHGLLTPDPADVDRVTAIVTGEAFSLD